MFEALLAIRFKLDLDDPALLNPPWAEACVRELEVLDRELEEPPEA